MLSRHPGESRDLGPEGPGGGKPVIASEAEQSIRS